MTNEGLLPQNQHLTIIPTGIKRHQHDINCEDAACEEVINMRYKDGSWRTVGDKQTEWDYNYYATEVFVHAMEGRSNIIAHTDEEGGDPSIQLIDGTNPAVLIFTIPSSGDPSLTERFRSFAGLKNLLIVTTEYAPAVGSEPRLANEYIFRWDEDTLAYTELTRNICPDVHFMYEHKSGLSIPPDYATQAELFDQIIIEKYKKRQKGYFCQSFILMQYALKLWDGTYIMHSNPQIVQMGNDNGYFFKNIDGAPEEQKYGTNLSSGIPIFYINFRDGVLAELEKYKGLVASLDIFMSQDISRYLFEVQSSPYDTDDDFEYYAFSNNTESINQLLNLHPYYLAKEVKFEELVSALSTTKFELSLNESTNKINYDGSAGSNIDEVEKIPVRHNTYSWKRGGWWQLLLGRVGPFLENPRFKGGDNVSYTSEDAEQTTETTDEAGSFVLQAQPELPVDDFSHHKLLCGSVPYTYNFRLHKGDITVRFGIGHTLGLWKYGAYTPTQSIDATIYQEVTLETDLGTKYIYEEITPWLFEVTAGNFILSLPNIVSYPDARATRLRIILEQDSRPGVLVQICDFTLTSHKIYNFAYAITNRTLTTGDLTYILFDVGNYAISETGAYSPPVICGQGADSVADEDRYYIDHNRMQVSRAQNALAYPSMNSYQFGNSDVRLLSFASQSAPVSDGQFGRYPLVCFTSHGIFLISLGGGEVLYSSIMPLNKEVAFKNSICELGGAIVFATAEGVKILAGTRVQHISRDVEGGNSLKLYSDSNYYLFLNDSDNLVNSYNDLSEENFLDYLDDNVRICYDKTQKEIIISNFDLFDDAGRYSNSPHSFVYNMQFRTWFKITQAWHQFVMINSVTYGMRNHRATRRAQGMENITIEIPALKDCFIQSRPMKWGTYDFKKPRTVVQRSLCYVGDPLDSTPEAAKKFGLYMFASLESDYYKFVKGIQVSQLAGNIQSPTLPGLHASVRNVVLITAVNSKDFIFSHWEVLREITMPGQMGAQARANTLTLTGDYNPDDYSSDFNIYTETL